MDSKERNETSFLFPSYGGCDVTTQKPEIILEFSKKKFIM